MSFGPWKKSSGNSGGERPITSSERDLFHHRRIAARVATSVSADRRHVALLGRFGTGKSSILNLVVAKLAQSRGTLIVADFDVWAVPNPEDVPRLALNRIVSALDDYVDTIEFRSLPLAYQRLAAAEPTGRRDIEKWKATHDGPLVGRLLASSDADENYVRVWEHFSDRHTEAELMELVEQVVAKVKGRDGSSAAADHSALIALWRRCNRRLRGNEHVEWLRALDLPEWRRFGQGAGAGAPLPDRPLDYSDRF